MNRDKELTIWMVAMAGVTFASALFGKQNFVEIGQMFMFFLYIVALVRLWRNTK
jgi:hypothetical protein